MKLEPKKQYKVDNTHRRIMRERIYYNIEQKNIDDPRDIIEETITVCADYLSGRSVELANDIAERLFRKGRGQEDGPIL